MKRRDEKAEALARKLGAAFAENVARAEAALVALSPEDWTAERLLEALKVAAEGAGVKLGDLMQPVRVVLTGMTVSEPVNELLLAVGREESLRRLAAIR